MLHAEIRADNRFGFFLVFPTISIRPEPIVSCRRWIRITSLSRTRRTCTEAQETARQAKKNNANEKMGTEPASGPVPLRLSSGCLVGRAIVPFSLHGLLTLPLGKFPLTFLALKEGHNVRPYAPGKGLHSRIRPVGLVDRLFLFAIGSPCSPCRCLAAAGSLGLRPVIITKCPFSKLVYHRMHRRAYALQQIAFVLIAERLLLTAEESSRIIFLFIGGWAVLLKQ